MPRKKMDVSSRPIPVDASVVDASVADASVAGPGALSPWLRLAHRRSQDKPMHDAYLRVLLDFEIVLQLTGSTWVWCDDLGGSVDVPAGSVVFLPPQFVHGWGNEAGEHIAVHFDLHAQPAMPPFENIRALGPRVHRRPLEGMPSFLLTGGEGDRPLALPLVTAIRSPRGWRERLEVLVRLHQRQVQRTLKGQLQAAQILTWAVTTLAEEAARAGLVEGAEDASAQDADERIEALLADLDVWRGERITVPDLAQMAGMGETAFRLAFRNATGQSPRDYLEARRVENASWMLMETDRTIVEIAAGEGYDDPYHFSRVFKRVTGRSPRAFRREARGRG